MPVITSQIIQVLPQTDGRSYVTERHTDHRGQDHTVEYLAAVGMDVTAVLAARAVNIGVTLDAREAVDAEAMKYALPLTRNEFMDRFTPAERAAIRTAAKTDTTVEDIMDYLKNTRSVYLAHSKTIQSVDYLVAIGVVTAARKEVILNG